MTNCTCRCALERCASEHVKCELDTQRHTISRGESSGIVYCPPNGDIETTKNLLLFVAESVRNPGFPCNLASTRTTIRACTRVTLSVGFVRQTMSSIAQRRSGERVATGTSHGEKHLERTCIDAGA
jgi:hypothetical protein